MTRRIADRGVIGAGSGGPSVAAPDGIGLWSFARADRLKMRALTRYIAPHPTHGELSKRAGGALSTPALFSDRTRAAVRLLAAFD
jgi:hypothetical protein